VKLFEPGRIGKLSIKNRIVMASMMLSGGALVEPDGRLSQQAIDYYVARAKGGVGLIITGSTLPNRGINSPQLETFPCLVMADKPMYIARLNQLVEAVHDYGVKIAIQFGLAFPPDVAPSAGPSFFDPSIMARAFTVEEIEEMVKAYGVATEIARTAGFDAIELNAHEGHNIDRFQSVIFNRRTDKYGGDSERRTTFALEVIEEVKRAAGADIPILYKYGLTHYFDGGREVEEGLEIARRLEAAGIAAITVDAGIIPKTMHWVFPPTTKPPGCNVDKAEMVKRMVNIPVMAIGKLGYPNLAEKVLQEGKADFIALGRTLLADPDWPIKVKEGRPEDIRPCIGCNECMSRLGVGKYLSCAVNPTTGIERELTIEPAEKKKSVLVVGGGPGGMEAARVAALRGHKVTLWEKGDALGGNLIPASVPDFKQDYRRLMDYLSTQIKKLGVAIELGREATLEQIQKMNPEVVFVATGSTPIIPDIPGVKKKKVGTAIDVLLGRKEVGESVVVLGGGLVGSEIALHLARQGKKVTIVEILNSVAHDMFQMNRMHLLVLLADNNVKILTETTLVEILDDSVVIIDKNGNKSKIENDTVVLALGFKPNRELVEALKDKVPEIHAIGDCEEPRRVINAIWEGFRFARLI